MPHLITSTWYAMFQSRDIQCIIPIYKGMPYFKPYGRQYLVLLHIGDIYILDELSKMLIKFDYFGFFAPHLCFYIHRIVGTTLNNDDELILYLKGRSFITLDIESLDIIQPELQLSEHPLFQYAFLNH
ncbi:hypothetical protein VCSRO12_2231 [Vibrio cholerae]|uniref:hypothetical protein n=1 Tax=Vibrio TaxID=662 RepID=UPI0011BDDF77|nr:MULTISPECIES: hypothetical protein [Vibrio]TXY16321.1 hypothetical protein FXE97_05375 [Vibrio cholerae]TXZ90957.1 hypothetical protein FXE42_06600 [Vibrio cholerae]GHX29454.1 hypothetical protein VCSRO62_0158 [Vibrio cholerae]GHY08245.1 hypothetical protein VCSRO112_1892 [Vibrio cholerae]GHY65778.1 hypothetical protein VCSRO12_2231 [Vibrio cholerae]